MTLALYDRVQETTATTGTGSITLGGAVAGYQSFAVVGNGNTCYYTIVNGSAWEVGIGTYSTTGPTLARTTVLSNSNADTSPINLSGASSVFLTYPAEKSVNLDADGVLSIGGALGYSDTGIIASFVSTETDYNQVIIQNKSTSPTASANLNISNDASTGSEGFAELGINSSTFTGSGSFSIPGAAYLASASTDLTIGTYGAYNIHFVTDSHTVDAMTIFNDGGVSLGGYGDPGIGTIAANKFVPGLVLITSSGGTTTLTSGSDYYQRVVGTSAHTIQLPDATTLLPGTSFIFDNDSTQSVTIKNGATTAIDSIPSTGIDYLYLTDNSTVAGTWSIYSFNPSNYDFSSTNADFGTATISNATWNGNAIAGNYGGTGLTTFVAANNALYSTSSSALTAGTLPIAAGGTGITSLTSGHIPYGNGTSGLNSSSSLQFNGSYLVVGGVSPLGGATNPITAFTGDSNNFVQTYVYNANVGTSASADFVAYADNGSDSSGFADLGFTSSVYADPTYTVTGPGEAYVFGSARASSGATGNLVYATDFTGTANAHQWYVGGFTQLKSAWKMQLTSTGLQLADALSTSYGGTGGTSAQAGMNNLAGAVTSGSYLRGNGTNVVMSAIQAADVPTLNQNTTGSAGSVANALTFATSGGAAAGSTYNGSATRTVDYSTVGAQATLVSGTNIKTVNGTSLLGSGNISISASPGGSDTQVQYNSSGSFAGSSLFTFTVSTGTVTATTFAGNLTGNASGSASTFTSTSQNSQFNSVGVGTAGSGTAGEIRATNNITAYYSDERLKTKVGDIEDPLAKVHQIKTMLYHANELAVSMGYDASIVEVGLSAQSVQRVQPEAVAPAPIDENYLTVRYERLVPLLIEAIKALDTKVAGLAKLLEK